MEVCSDPIPSKTTWDWGSLRVEAGQVNCCCITSVYPSGEQAFYHLLGLAWTILSRANGPTPRTWGLLHCSFGREKSQSCRFATLFPTRRECPWDRPICSGAQCQRYVKHICFHCVNSILKSVFQNLSPWPPSLELSSPSLFFLSFWSSFFYTPTKNKSSVLKVSFAYFFWIGKKPLNFISVDCSVGFYMSHFLPSAKMSSLGNYRFPICFYCVYILHQKGTYLQLVIRSYTQSMVKNR